MKKQTVLVFLLVTISSFGQKKDIQYSNLKCQFIKDFSGKTIANQKKIIVYLDTDSYDRNSKFLIEYLGATINQSNLRGDKNSKITCDLPDHFELCKDRLIFDSLSTLYEMMDTYDVLVANEMMDTIRYPKKLDLDFVPLQIGQPVFYRNYAVISRNVTSSTNHFLYEYKKKKWTFCKLLDNPDR